MKAKDFWDALRHHKIQGRLGEEGNILFAHESLNLCLRWEEADPDFFSLEFGGAFPDITVSDEELYAYRLLAAAITREKKSARFAPARTTGAFSCVFSCRATSRRKCSYAICRAT